MMELIFFGGVIALVAHNLRQLGVGRPAKVGHHAVSAELKQLMEYAERAYLERKYLSAEKLYLKALKMDHKNALAYRRIGLIYSAQKNYDEAIESFQIASHLDPSAVNHFNLGVAYYENSNYIKALAAFEKGLIFKNSADLYNALGKVHQRMHHPDEAIAAFRKAAELGKNPNHLRNLAEALKQAGQTDEAKKILAQL